MKRCKHCNVNVVADKNYCPLCYNDLEDDGKGGYPLLTERTTNERIPRKAYFLARLFLLISIVVVAVCLYINLTTSTSYLWSVVVLVSIVYLWILIAHTIISKRSVFEKIAFQLIGVLSILCTTYFLAPVVNENWLVKYVIPSVSMLATAVLLFISFINRNRGKYLLSFVAVYLSLIILSVTLVCTLDTFKTINHICIFVNAIATLGTLLLGYKWVHKEFIKNFHL